VNGVLELEGTPGSLTADAYRPALFIMVALMTIGFLANQFIKPVDEEFFMDERDLEQAGHVAGATTIAPTGRF
ncbi:MAG: hypothetical protein ACRC0L_05905, partial [Angustibacter sp.]